MIDDGGDGQTVITVVTSSKLSNGWVQYWPTYLPAIRGLLPGGEQVGVGSRRDPGPLGGDRDGLLGGGLPERLDDHRNSGPGDGLVGRRVLGVEDVGEQGDPGGVGCSGVPVTGPDGRERAPLQDVESDVPVITVGVRIIQQSVSRSESQQSCGMVMHHVIVYWWNCD